MESRCRSAVGSLERMEEQMADLEKEKKSYERKAQQVGIVSPIPRFPFQELYTHSRQSHSQISIPKPTRPLVLPLYTVHISSLLWPVRLDMPILPQYHGYH